MRFACFATASESAAAAGEGAGGGFAAGGGACGAGASAVAICTDRPLTSEIKSRQTNPAFFKECMREQNNGQGPAGL